MSLPAPTELCIACGYDLQATAAGAGCPECGETERAGSGDWRPIWSWIAHRNWPGLCLLAAAVPVTVWVFLGFLFADTLGDFLLTSLLAVPLVALGSAGWRALAPPSTTGAMKLRRLIRIQQVLCVAALPVIAAGVIISYAHFESRSSIGLFLNAPRWLLSVTLPVILFYLAPILLLHGVILDGLMQQTRGESSRVSIPAATGILSAALVCLAGVLLSLLAFVELFIPDVGEGAADLLLFIAGPAVFLAIFGWVVLSVGQAVVFKR